MLMPFGAYYQFDRVISTDGVKCVASQSEQSQTTLTTTTSRFSNKL